MKALLRRPEACIGLFLVLGAALMALLAPWIAPYDPLAIDLARKLMPPSAAHWMGTDQNGRDILSRIIWGARPSLTVGVLAVTIGVLGGVAIGLSAGYVRGLVGAGCDAYGGRPRIDPDADLGDRRRRHRRRRSAPGWAVDSAE